VCAHDASPIGCAVSSSQHIVLAAMCSASEDAEHCDIGAKTYRERELCVRELSRVSPWEDGAPALARSAGSDVYCTWCLRASSMSVRRRLDAIK
jgi:hypothetical protein